MARPPPDSKTHFTTHQAARALGVSLATVVNWVDSGKLSAHKTPGGHRRIAYRDLVTFSREHALPMSRQAVLGPKDEVRVLIIDDEKDFADLVVEYLELHGERFDVAVATSGFYAGLAIGRFSPHVVLLDLMMPDIDGFEVFRMLREDRETHAIPVIACTAFADAQTEARCKKAGFDGFLGKPVRLKTLPGVLLDAVGLGT